MSSTLPLLATLPPLLCFSCDLPSSLPLHSLSLIMAYPLFPLFSACINMKGGGPPPLSLPLLCSEEKRDSDPFPDRCSLFSSPALH